MSISRRRMAAIMLADVYHVGAVLTAHGEILNPAGWVEVLANLLSSAPPKWDGSRKAKNAPENFSLTVATLTLACRRSGTFVKSKLVAEQVTNTKIWRNKESTRLGRQHYASMTGKTIGLKLGVTAAVRTEAKAWSIIPYGATKEELALQYREREGERDVARRRARSAKPHELSLSRTKPWEAMGFSRSTFERRRAAGTLPELPVKPSVTASDQAKKTAIRTDRILH
jgi:hypothetical protein